ncbi:hypothetical protein GC425_05695 [Corynebacterium sp. zg254]|uniref:DUF2339 domain-containing protein n=1 Tax=Corynebacterium zhongnanshanii TaxID=2768834 RepID=A0ABQ6VD52_9CORY|nr:MULTISPECIES: hypothetical protein [Corynebacterium]KAB3520746.1 hypothetical protein F8377_05715 [Corynebacterium zhongnanshanii]MCR5914358.1 hypothetical protein [Corynebacterium sp. zg254]
MNTSESTTTATTDQILRDISRILKANSTAQSQLAVRIDRFIRAQSTLAADQSAAAEPQPATVAPQPVSVAPQPAAAPSEPAQSIAQPPRGLPAFPQSHSSTPTSLPSRRTPGGRGSVFHRPPAGASVQPSSTTGAVGHRFPRRSIEFNTTRILAIFGSIITIIGLVFCAALALASGVITPQMMVCLAGVLSAAFIAAGVVTHARKMPDVLAPSLVIVGVMGGLVDVWIAVYGIEWLTPEVGAVLISGICALGTALAFVWKHETLAVIVTALSPIFIVPIALMVLAEGHFTVPQSMYFSASVALSALIGFAARWGHAWKNLNITATIVYVGGMILALSSVPTLFVLGSLALIILTVLAFRSEELPARDSAFTTIAITVTPVALLVLEEPLAAVIYALVASTFSTAITMIAVNSPQAHERCVSLALAMNLGGLATALVVNFYSQPFTSPLSILSGVGVAALTSVLVAVRARVPHALVVYCLIAVVITAYPHALASWFHYEDTLLPAAPVVLVATSVALAYAAVHWKSLITLNQPAPIMAGFVALVTSSACIPALFQLVHNGHMSFMLAHTVISLLWIVLGIVVLHRGVTSTGLGVIVVAFLKLIFWDLSVLGGVVQVIAFIACGSLLLLAAGLRERHQHSSPQK